MEIEYEWEKKKALMLIGFWRAQSLVNFPLGGTRDLILDYEDLSALRWGGLYQELETNSLETGLTMFCL